MSDIFPVRGLAISLALFVISTTLFWFTGMPFYLAVILSILIQFTVGGIGLALLILLEGARLTIGDDD
jgi:hypothetical protein